MPQARCCCQQNQQHRYGRCLLVWYCYNTAPQVYLRYASKYGVALSEDEVLHRFRRAYNTPWGRSHIRYVGDGRPFW